MKLLFASLFLTFFALSFAIGINGQPIAEMRIDKRLSDGKIYSSTSNR